jgi:hypothetical protein
MGRAGLSAMSAQRFLPYFVLYYHSSRSNSTKKLESGYIGNRSCNATVDHEIVK